MIKISVIVATRNRYQKLKRAIRSIEKQSLKDFEIIIVNDASTDETYDFLESIKNRNINIIHNKVSIGCAGARNKGIKEAKGEFLVFLDDDDEYLPKKLETHFNIMEKSKIDMKWLTTLRNGDKDLQSILFNLITVYKKLEAYNKSEFNKNVNLLIEDIKKYEDKKEKVKRRIYSSRDNQSVLEKLEIMDDIFYFRFIDVIETDSIYTIRTCSSKSRLYFCSNASKKIEIELLILGFEECEIFGISHQIMIRKGEIKKIVIMRNVESGWNHLKILNDSICKRIAILDVKIVAN